jgi:hypothetical protein
MGNKHLGVLMVKGKSLEPLEPHKITTSTLFVMWTDGAKDKSLILLLEVEDDGPAEGGEWEAPPPAAEGRRALLLPMAFKLGEVPSPELRMSPPMLDERARLFAAVREVLSISLELARCKLFICIMNNEWVSSKKKARRAVFFPFQSQETRGIFREKSPNHQRETKTEAPWRCCDSHWTFLIFCQLILFNKRYYVIIFSNGCGTLFFAYLFQMIDKQVFELKKLWKNKRQFLFQVHVVLCGSGLVVFLFPPSFLSLNFNLYISSVWKMDAQTGA